jgi:trehalose 6-phosphate phosphatase
MAFGLRRRTTQVRYLFGIRAAAALQRIAAGGLLLAFDFDGTLAPIIEDRDRAAMRASTRRLFERLCARAPCAVLSGRARRDVERRLLPARPAHVVGAHGADGGPSWEAEADARTAAMARYLAAAVANLPGVAIELAHPAVAVHYRLASRPVRTRAAILDAATSLGSGYRVVEGLRVVSLVPATAPDKGDALRHLLRLAGRQAALFIGDDLTDEDAFGAVGEFGIAIRVGPSRRSVAGYFIRGQTEIDRLLRLLLAAF